ncbi:hypothetical protein Taro_021356 [Colocasia esculenta]|uniref:Aminotransferase-like plant mobile domain-containing protein n=1 Tax=Colocasia esculenta TaxID=4460 RepID=A0A843V4S9_COLES|nr:hypothetical protein [Colocasia esculenta]
MPWSLCRLDNYGHQPDSQDLTLLVVREASGLGPRRAARGGFTAFLTVLFPVGPFARTGFAAFAPAFFLSARGRGVLIPGAILSVLFYSQLRFPTLAGTALALRRRGTKGQTSGQAERHAYIGALKPLVRLDSSLMTSGGSSASPSVYTWWRHFLLDYGYPPDAALSSPILPGSFNNALWREWERHIRHSIARVGLIEFVSQIESGTRLLDFWSVVVGAGNVVKIPPEKVVLPPTFSPAPSGKTPPTIGSAAPARRLVPCSRLPAGGPLGHLLRMGKLYTPPEVRIRLGPHPMRIRSPWLTTTTIPLSMGRHPDVADLPRASPTEQGHASANIMAGEGAGCPDVTVPVVDGSAALQTIHDLLTSGPETGLPDCSDFNFVESDERVWPQVLHSAMAISSTAELPAASPPEKGEIPRRTSGETNAELIEASPADASPPSTAGVAGAETTSHDAVVASSLPGTSEPLPGGSADGSAGECLHLPETSSLGTTTGDASETACPAEGQRSTPTSLGVRGWWPSHRTFYSFSFSPSLVL